VVSSSSSSIFFFSSPNLSRRRLDVTHSYTHGSANLRCRSETCCMGLTENTGRKKSPKVRHLRTIVQRCRAISSQLRHVSTIGKKNLLSSNISSRCSRNMVYFGPLSAEIGPVVWGTPVNFNGFRVLAALLAYCTALQYWASAKLCSVEQRAPPIFDRAAIMLVIGPHSSCCYCTVTSRPTFIVDMLCVVVMVITSVVFSVLLLLLTVELIWRTRQLRYSYIH